jgi:subtilase family serine protease
MKHARTLAMLAVCGLPGYPALAQEAARQQLSGHLTGEMNKAPLVSRVSGSTQMTLTIGLQVANTAELEKAAADIADPKSPSYRQFLTPEQFADRFGASAADYQSVLDWAAANHLTAQAHRNRFVATVTGNVADIESALNVHMNYRLRADGTQFFAPDAEPSIALAVPVQHIGGLDNFSRPQSAGGSAPGGQYQGTDFRNAYAPQITMTGVGQKVGIFMADGFAQSDINGYAKQVGQSYHTVQVVPAGTSLTPGAEGTLDVESILSMAPSAQVVAFVGASTAILTNMVDRPDIKQMSSSWFWYNGTQTDINLMLEMSMQGQSFFQASGDGGALWPGVFPNFIDGKLDCRQFPNITIVGGTSLNMTNEGANYGVLETAWNDSSGGSYASVPIPAYQLPVAGKNGASASLRNTPDVAAQGADIVIYYNGAPASVAGTSLATPLWAGYMALVNELASAGSMPSPGFVNPALYALVDTPAYSANFHDIVGGCTPNGLSGSKENSYCAGEGYDLTTGLGSPTTALVYTLSGVQSYPLYCQGPLSQSNNQTSFKWAPEAAGSQAPGPGECAWADRTPSGSEILPGNKGLIAGDMHQVANLGKSKFAEIGVFGLPNGSGLSVTQVVGIVNPPFSSSPVLP